MDKHQRGSSGYDSDQSTSYVSTSKRLQRTIQELQKRYKSYDVDRAAQRVVHGVVRGAACGIVRCCSVRKGTMCDWNDF